MLVKVFARGSSADKAGRGPVDYALGDRNHEGELRDRPTELLRGDPEITNSVIESLPQHRDNHHLAAIMGLTFETLKVLISGRSASVPKLTLFETSALSTWPDHPSA
jgi:hypothetical protein